MNTLGKVRLVALLVSVGCAACSETTVDGPIYSGSADRGAGAALDTAAPREPFVERQVTVREIAMHPHVLHREGEYVVCAQCR